jgi:hypothetical protein
MNIITNGFHPSFDALSATADRSDLDAARTRTGRHVARCATCAAVVAEIREMGAAARAIDLSGAPAGLWARIERQAVNEPAPSTPRPTPSPEREEVWAPAPSLRPTILVPSPLRRRALRVGVGILAAAAAVLIVALIWPSQQNLEASGTSRLTFAPGRPHPGGTLAVRYQPAPQFKDASELVLVGEFVKPAGHGLDRYRIYGSLGDSLATLRRMPDGSFQGRVVLPADFLALRMTISDLAGAHRDADGFDPWIVIGGTPAREPSLPSLLAALEFSIEYSGRNGPWLPRQGVVVSDSLRKYFPDHPSGWAHSQSYGRQKGKFDLIRFFENAQHRYSSFDAKLWPRENLDAERLHDMVVFAGNIDEPAELMKWAARLAKEHPEDPRAVYDLGRGLHEIELRQPAGFADSIRAWLPILQRAYVAGGSPMSEYSDVPSLVERYGDDAVKQAWKGQARARLTQAQLFDRAGRQHGVPDALVPELREMTGRQCVRPAGRYPLRTSLQAWLRNCERERGQAYGLLAQRARLDGDPARALRESDSALAAMARGYLCAPSRGYWERALVMLSQGDTTAAERAMVNASAWASGNHPDSRDTARVYLGGRFDEARWQTSVDSVHRIAVACEKQQRAARIARGDPFGW